MKKILLLIMVLTLVFAAAGPLFSEPTRTELTPQDIEFLTKQCLIDQADVNVIPKLDQETRMEIFSWIEKRDCKLFEPFKASRAYYKQLKPKTRLPQPPAGWHTKFLTRDEYERYVDIVANPPW